MLAAAMEEVLALIPSPRRRSPVEAPAHLTRAYAELAVANGFARLGEPARARSIRDGARDALKPVLTDPAHAYLLAAFSAHVDLVCAGAAPDAPLPEELAAQRGAMSRMDRFKVDRLREASPTLCSGPIDAIGSFSRRGDLPEEPWRNEVRTAAPDEVDRMLVEASLGDPRLPGCFDALLDLDEAVAMSVLAVAIRRLVAAGDAPIELVARALTIAARFGFGELLPDLVPRLLRSRDELATVLSPALRALRRLGMTGELAEVLARFEQLPPRPPAELALTVAAARNLVHGTPAAPIFERIRRPLDTMLLSGQTGMIRVIAGAATHGDIELALGQLRELTRCYQRATDSFGTNSHYSVTVVHFIESLTHAITDLKLSTLRLRDPADAPFLAWKYAL